MVQLGRQRFVCYMIGVLLPLVATLLCAVLDGIPEKQTMMVSLGRTQIIIGNALIFLVVSSIFACLIIFSRAKNEHNSFFGIISDGYEAFIPHKKGNNRKSYALLAQENDENEENEDDILQRDTAFDDPELGNGNAISGHLAPRCNRNSDELKSEFFYLVLSFFLFT